MSERQSAAYPHLMIPKTTHGTYLHPGTPEYTAAILKIQAAAHGKEATKESK